MRKQLIRLLILIASGQGAAALAQPDYDVQEHYNKYEHLIPMRDGVRLFTSVYAPKDTSGTHPFLIQRTPYSVSPYGSDSYPEVLGPHVGRREPGGRIDALGGRRVAARAARPLAACAARAARVTTLRVSPPRQVHRGEGRRLEADADGDGQADRRLEFPSGQEV